MKNANSKLLAALALLLLLSWACPTPRPVPVCNPTVFARLRSLAQGIVENNTPEDTLLMASLWSKVCDCDTSASDTLLANDLHTLGNSLIIAGKYVEAQGIFLKVVHLRKHYYGLDSFHMDILRAYRNLGITWEEGPEQNFRRALEYYELVNNHVSKSLIRLFIPNLLQMGIAYQKLGELNQAKRYLQQGYDIIKVHPSDTDYEYLSTKLLKEYASCCRKLQLFDQSIRLSKAGMALTTKNSTDWANFQLIAGNAWQDTMLLCTPDNRGKIRDTAIFYTGQALTTYDSLKTPDKVRLASGNLGELYRRAKLFPEAKRVLEKAIGMGPARAADLSDFAPLYINLGEVHFDQHRPDLALGEYNAALNCLHPKGDGKAALITFLPVNWPNLFYTFGNIAKTHLYRHSLGQIDGQEKALAAYDSLAKLANLIRVEFVTEPAKFDLAAKMQGALSSAVSVCRQLFETTGQAKYKEQAFDFSEQSKGFALIEAVRLRSMGVTSPNQQERQAASLKDLGLNSLQDLLDVNQGLVTYFMGNTSLHIFLLKKDSLHWERVGISKDSLAKMADRFGALIHEPPQDRAEFDIKYKELGNLGFALYQILIYPIQKKHTLPERLVIVPSEPFQGIPFEALSPEQYKGNLDSQNSQKNFLLYHRFLSYATSANLWGEMTRKKGLIGAVAAFAPSFNPALRALGSDSLPPLPNNKNEVNSIVKVARDRIRHVANTKTAFLEAAGYYGALHVSTHGVANDRDPNRSFIAFDQPGTVVDTSQLLYLRDLYAQSLPQQLIVLSACETNVGQYIAGEGNLSIARGLTYAGTRSFVTTLWPIKTSPSVVLMPAFYQAMLVDEVPKDMALTEAKRQYLSQRPGAPVSDWAGFVLYGSTVPLQTSGGRISGAWILGVTIVFILSAWIFRRRRMRLKNFEPA